MSHPFFLLLFSSFLWLSCQAPASKDNDRLRELRQELALYCQPFDAQIGIGLITAQGDTLTVNNRTDYPLMSVFKFHQALAVTHLLEQRGLALTDSLHIPAEALAADSYSPLKKEHPQGNLYLSHSELLRYTLQLSDNLVCDFLFRQFLSPQETALFLKDTTGIRNFQLEYNEVEMKEDPARCYQNQSSPYAAAKLLQLFAEGKIVSEPYLGEIRKHLLHCQTGRDKIPGFLQQEPVRIGHKTGSGPTLANGRIVADNDLGFAVLPDGQQYYLAVFIKDALLTPQETAAIIAEISRRTYKALTQQQ